MLSLKVLKCSNLRNVARVIKQDPFVSIKLEDIPESGEDRTGVCIAGGKNPKWLRGNVVHLKVPYRPEDVHCIVEVWDKEFTQANRLIGTGRLALKEYDEDGAEEQPMEIELFYENKPAGQVSCLFSYDPPAVPPPPVPSQETSVRAAAGEKFRKVKEKMQEGNAFRVGAQLLEMWRNLGWKDQFKIIAVVLSVVFIPILWSLFMFLVYLTFGLTWYTTTWIILPLVAITGMPRFLGWGLTSILAIVLHGYPLTFGSIALMPFITDRKRLRIRLTATDFFMGNPQNQGFTSKFLSLDRLDLTCAVQWKDLIRLVTSGFKPEPCPLKKVPDFERLLTVEIDRLEFDGFTIDFQVSNRNRLNINELTREFALGEVKTSLNRRGIPLDKFRFPNCLEVQVVRARNLLAMDSDGLSDPYYVIKMRKDKRKSDPVMKCLNPLFPSKIERFALHDPSAVIQIQIWDADFGKSDFIGQWLMTTKWLLMDPKHCDFVEWEGDSMPEAMRNEGWVGMWAPLLDAHFRGRGTRGDVHLRLRWTHNPEFPPRQNPPPATTLKPIEQITQNRLETRMRVGDLSALISKLNHIPVLFDFRGPVMIRDTKVSINDLFFGSGHRGTSSSSGGGGGGGSHSGIAATMLKKLKGGGNGSTNSNNSNNNTTAAATGAPATSSTPPATLRILKRNLSESSADSAGSSASPRLRTHSLRPTSDASNASSPKEPQSPDKDPTTLAATKATGGLLQRWRRGLRGGSGGNAKTKEGSEHQTEDEEAEDPVPSPPLATAAGNDDGRENDDYYEELDGNDDIEYEENGRRFVKVNIIEWHSQFKARHGDPGLPIFKVLDRFFRGLAPKLMANQKLHLRFLGTTFRGFVIDELMLFKPDNMAKATVGAAVRVVATAQSLAKAAKEQTRFVEKKYFRNAGPSVSGGGILFRQSGGITTDDETDVGDHVEDVISPEAGGEPHPRGLLFQESGVGMMQMMSASSSRDSSTTAIGHHRLRPYRKAEATDQDFITGQVLLSGKLEASWEGRKSSASIKLFTGLFSSQSNSSAASHAAARKRRKWRVWQTEIKGDTVFFRKDSQMIWYVLDLSDVTGLFLEEADEGGGEDVCLRFGGGPLTLRLRVPVQPVSEEDDEDHLTTRKKQVTDVSLDDWVALLTRMRQKQQGDKYAFAKGLDTVLQIFPPPPPTISTINTTSVSSLPPMTPVAEGEEDEPDEEEEEEEEPVPPMIPAEEARIRQLSSSSATLVDKIRRRFSLSSPPNIQRSLSTPKASPTMTISDPLPSMVYLETSGMDEAEQQRSRSDDDEPLVSKD